MAKTISEILATPEVQAAIKLLSKERLDSLMSVKKISKFDDYNVYEMTISYDYDVDKLTPIIEGTPDTDAIFRAILEEALPGFPVEIPTPNFGCCAFSLQDEDGSWRMGRGYDFRFDSSAMLVRCNPKDGYRSVALAALDNVMANDPSESVQSRLSCLTTPFVALDGMNEKGVSICVLTLDSEPTCQRSGKPVLATSILIRLVLDRAATTEEAVELISKYDVLATCGRDYHFFISDASGDSRAIEFDCESPTRDLAVTPARSVTNYFQMYIDRVEPNQRNGIYGHGKERRDAIESVLDSHGGVGGKDVAWEALKAAAQEPNPESITSNTQWSVIYNNTTLDFELVLRRRWDDTFRFAF